MMGLTKGGLMKINRHEALETASMRGIQHQTLAGNLEGLSKMSVWSQTIAPGAATPPHRHDCEEVVVFLEGEGEIIYKGEVNKFQAPCTIVLEPDCEHQIINSGTKDMKVIAALSVSPVEAFFPNNEKIELPWRT